MPRSRRYRRYGRRNRRYGRRRTYGTRRFKKGVRRTVYQMAECKQASYNITFPHTGSVIYVPLTPDVNQGSGDGQRIGNVIRARNFQVKININSTPGNISAVRVFIVWPRKLSFGDAVNLINNTNFPNVGLVDQDNWIVWYDKIHFLQQPAVYGRSQTRRLVFNKRFFAKLEYRTGTAVAPNKSPYIIFNCPYVSTQLYTVEGYCKMSYKDI